MYDKHNVFHERGGDSESTHHTRRDKIITHFCKQDEICTVAVIITVIFII